MNNKYRLLNSKENEDHTFDLLLQNVETDAVVDARRCYPISVGGDPSIAQVDDGVITITTTFNYGLHKEGKDE